MGPEARAGGGGPFAPCNSLGILNLHSECTLQTYTATQRAARARASPSGARWCPSPGGARMNSETKMA
eukprot:4081293-Pyramimonas_sp.AAC.1